MPPPKKKPIVRRLPPPRTIMGAFDLLKEKGIEANLGLLTTSQLEEVHALYNDWLDARSAKGEP